MIVNKLVYIRGMGGPYFSAICTDLAVNGTREWSKQASEKNNKKLKLEGFWLLIWLLLLKSQE